MITQRYERLDPEGPCVSPDGHDLVDSLTYASPIPDAVVCVRCGQEGTVVVLPVDEADTRDTRHI